MDDSNVLLQKFAEMQAAFGALEKKVDANMGITQLQQQLITEASFPSVFHPNSASTINKWTVGRLVTPKLVEL